MQCVLPVNFLLEKIYVFLWFWFVFVALMGVLSLLAWLNALINPCTRRRFVIRYLRIAADKTRTRSNTSTGSNTTPNAGGTSHLNAEESATSTSERKCSDSEMSAAFCADVDWSEPHMAAQLTNQKELRHAFVDKFLRSDGVLVLRLIAVNLGSDLCLAGIVFGLWQKFLSVEPGTSMASMKMMRYRADGKSAKCGANGHGMFHCPYPLDGIHGMPLPLASELKKRTLHTDCEAMTKAADSQV